MRLCVRSCWMESTFNSGSTNECIINIGPLGQTQMIGVYVMLAVIDNCSADEHNRFCFYFQL